MARLEWQIATVRAIKAETPRVKSLTLALPDWQPHRAGQHYDVRLTAEDGYEAQRSYSVASEPERRGEIDLTVERIEDGEVSPYLHDVLLPGDQIQVRGPIGGYFVWTPGETDPLLLIGGGSGVVPLMSMLRERAAARSHVPVRLLYSVRTPDDVIYRAELERANGTRDGAEVIFTYTRTSPAGWSGYARRIDAPMLREVLAPLGPRAQVFICGPTALVESAANALGPLGVPAGRIKTERFGPSGT